MSRSTILPVLERVIGRCAASARRTWTPSVHTTFAEAFALASRRLGRTPVEMTAEESAQLESSGLCRERWEADELARIAVLVKAADVLDGEQLATLADECYRHGDMRERQAVLRALPVLPEADWTVGIGVDACRSSVQPIFEAIACDNPFPASRFPELNFNQMVLKALFTDVRLEQIVGLDGRVTPELCRMAAAYASERRAAGRSVPPDIHRLTDAAQEDDR
jgi:hypothetical protein